MTWDRVIAVIIVTVIVFLNIIVHRIELQLKHVAETEALVREIERERIQATMHKQYGDKWKLDYEKYAYPFHSFCYTK